MSKIVGAVVILLVALVFGPLISIWSLNTLFALGIEYTVWTWLAMVWIGVFFRLKLGQRSS
jgi:hypothetical protein